MLDLPAEMAQQLVARKSARAYTDKTVDLQEADVDYLSRVRDVYRQLAGSDERWKTVSVVDDNGVRPIETVAEDVCESVTAALTPTVSE